MIQLSGAVELVLCSVLRLEGRENVGVRADNQAHGRSEEPPHVFCLPVESSDLLRGLAEAARWSLKLVQCSCVGALAWVEELELTLKLKLKIELRNHPHRCCGLVVLVYRVAWTNDGHG